MFCQFNYQDSQRDRVLESKELNLGRKQLLLTRQALYLSSQLLAYLLLEITAMIEIRLFFSS